MIALLALSSILITADAGSSGIRTSNAVDGFVITTSDPIPGRGAIREVNLCAWERGKLVPRMKLSERYDYDGKDRLVRAGKHFVALLSLQVVSKFDHRFLECRADGSFVMKRDDIVRYGGDVVRVGKTLVGSYRVSTDYGPPEQGNWLYRISAEGVELGRLPGVEEYYDVSSAGHGRFNLEAWTTDGRKSSKWARLSIPELRDGFWVLPPCDP